MALSMLKQGISLSEIQTSDVMFYLQLVSYQNKLEEEKKEAELDKLGL